MSDQINNRRRRFSVPRPWASERWNLDWPGLPRPTPGIPPIAEPSRPPARPGRRVAGSSAATFGTIKQIDAGALNIGYAEAGPSERAGR